ncbi:MAG: aminopeptidase [Candidatus Thermoplasmatota archaeon]|nr:aminopeptidase [Candidatus Thermoplasmatota archaeon]
MIDQRIKKLAQILVNYSLEIKKNDLFAIYGNQISAFFIKEVYRQAMNLGAHPYTNLALDGLGEIFFNNAKAEQLTYVSPVAKFEIEKINARLVILSPWNTKNMTNVDPKKQSIRSVAQQPLHDIFMKRAAKGDLRWCVTQFPCNASAQDAEMSLEDYENFIFKAAHVDKKNPIEYWRSVFEKQEEIKNILEKKKNLHVIAKDTDLTLSVENRKWINCAGKENFPDGEVFTGPVENSANGYISYSFPAVHGGREVDGIKLWFEKGKVFRSKATKGESFLKTMLNMDKGSNRIGEFAFGMNSGIKKYSKNTLFDEKIGGTIHIAVGLGYPESGSINKSGLHWDMVCDLRKEGEVYADNELIYKQGRFVI